MKQRYRRIVVKLGTNLLTDGDQLDMEQIGGIVAQIATLRDALHDAFEDTVKAEQFEPLRTSHGLLSVTHLVDRSRFDAYRARVAQVRDQQPQLRFLATGPWPPYSFAA